MYSNRERVKRKRRKWWGRGWRPASNSMGTTRWCCGSLIPISKPSTPIFASRFSSRWKAWRISSGKNAALLLTPCTLSSTTMRATTKSPISLIIPNLSASIPLLMGLYFRVFLSTRLPRFPIAFSCARFRLHVVDLDPSSISSGGWLEDTSLVEKYQISEEAYNKRQGMSPKSPLFFLFFSNSHGRWSLHLSKFPCLMRFRHCK